MNSLTNRQRVLVFAIGFLMGCIVLSMIQHNKQLARDANPVLDEGVPGVIRFYAENGFPLDGPFVLETTELEEGGEGWMRRVVLIGSKDRLEMYRIEEFMSGTMGVDAVVERWVVTDPREVRVVLAEGVAPADISQQLKDMGYTLRRKDPELDGYRVSVSQLKVSGVDEAIRELETIHGVAAVHPLVLSFGERLEPEKDS